ncbi:potassium/proton antiporter [Salinibius halmophilus]|uniref:potassium/proton antiporter n=1 Tax=Salinibius halmophilus TaxID=1853216 RepID=UPI000E66CC2E|nr:potassium/proton antiporter [Salinibius halmophilus]
MQIDSLQWLLIVGALLTASVLANVFARRLGTPILLLFLIIGIASQGMMPELSLSQIQFVASLCLAIILFDGGINTDHSRFRVGLKPALSLATLGVFITAMFTGVAASWLFDLPLVYGLLLGSIIASTDAAAVFGILGSSGQRLSERISATLEIESGSNDPMAVFLTLAVISWIQQDSANFLEQVQLFAQQMGLGLAIGWASGKGASEMLKRLAFSTSFSALLATGLALVVFSGTSWLGGSGFLAVYIAGVMLANQRNMFSVQQFHTSLAWMGQIALFLMLGLLVDLQDLWALAMPSLLISLLLMFVARPLAVWISLWWFKFSWRENAFISWVGLRGAVPVVLATFPLVAGIDYANIYFDAAFFVVILSLIIQGWTVPHASKLFKVVLPPLQTPVHQSEFADGKQLLGFTISHDWRAGEVEQHNWPAGVVPVFFAKGGEQHMAVDESTQLVKGDVLYLVCPGEQEEALQEQFTYDNRRTNKTQRAFFGDFKVQGSTLLADLGAVYGLEVSNLSATTVAELFEQQFKRPVVGDEVNLGAMTLVVHKIADGQCFEASLRF